MSLLLAGVSLCVAACNGPGEAQQVDAGSYPRPWIGLHFCLTRPEQVPDLKRLIAEALRPLGFNTLVLDLSYSGFRFRSDPKVAADPRWETYGITAEQAREIGDVCRANGIRVVPYFNNMGHQNAPGGPDYRNALLTQYPQFLLGGPPDCPSWNSMMPDVYPIVLGMIDGVIDAFRADAFHVGMDEVYQITREDDPLTRGKDPAELFAGVVNRLHERIVDERGCEMLMWQDTISGWHQGETMRRVADMIPKDIVICNWDYADRREYPDVPWYQGRGFRVMTAGWENPAATESLVRYAQRTSRGRLVGHLYTNWDSHTLEQMRTALLAPETAEDVPPHIRGMARGVHRTIGLLRPAPMYQLEVTTPLIRGMVSDAEPLRVRAGVGTRGIYGGSFTAAEAIVTARGEGGAPTRQLGRVRSADASACELEAKLPSGTYQLRLRGLATETGGSRSGFAYEGPRVTIVAGDPAASALAAELVRHHALIPVIARPPQDGRLLAEASIAELAASLSTSNEGWLAGPYPADSPVTIGMVFANNTGSQTGDHCTVRAALQVPDHRGRLQVCFFRSDDYRNPDWPGYRFYQLLVDGELVWEEDVTRDESADRWVSVDVTDAVGSKRQIEAAIRVLDKRGVGNYGTACLVGPLRLVAVDDGSGP